MEPVRRDIATSEPLASDTDLEKTLRRENASLRETIADLAGQIKRHSESQVISPGQLEAFAAQKSAFEAANAEMNAIAIFLRENFAKEIAAGRHSNRSLSDIVCGYMRRSWMDRVRGWFA